MVNFWSTIGIGGPPQQKWGKGNVDAQGNVIDPTLDYDGNPLPPESGEPGFFSQFLGLDQSSLPKSQWAANGINPQTGTPYPKGEAAKTSRPKPDAPYKSISEKAADRDRANSADARVKAAFEAPQAAAPEQKSGIEALTPILADNEMAPSETTAPAWTNPLEGVTMPAAQTPEQMMAGIRQFEELNGKTPDAYGEYEQYLKDDLAELKANKPSGDFGSSDLLRFGLAMASSGNIGQAGQALLDWRDTRQKEYKAAIRDNMKSVMDIQVARRAAQMEDRRTAASYYAAHIAQSNAAQSNATNLQIKKLELDAAQANKMDERAYEEKKAADLQRGRLDLVAARAAAKGGATGGYSDTRANNMSGDIEKDVDAATKDNLSSEYNKLLQAGDEAGARRLRAKIRNEIRSMYLADPSLAQFNSGIAALDGSSDDDDIIGVSD